MAKLQSPLKKARLEMDLSRSELASLVYPSRSDMPDKAELSQAIGRCEAGLLDPKSDGGVKLLFTMLAKNGYMNLRQKQQDWFDNRVAELEKGS